MLGKHVCAHVSDQFLYLFLLYIYIFLSKRKYDDLISASRVTTNVGWTIFCNSMLHRAKEIVIF